MNKNHVRAVFQYFQQANPTPTTELVYHSTFELLIAVILSAQATDISVNKATLPLFLKHNTPASIAQLGEPGLTNYIKSIGLYRSKARHIIQTCQQLLDNHHGEVPTTRVELEALPGVGRKTANVVLNTAFNEPTLAVDTHIFRVANRMGLAKGSTPRQVEDQLLAAIPQLFLKDAHHWLILHGRYTCMARSPQCADCGVKKWCAFNEKTP